jgi:uncharacterized protein YegL
MIRRLPVYILADCSGSMTGDPIEQVKTGIRTLHANLMGDPSAVETAFLSVIAFDSEARQVVPLVEVTQFEPPDLRASGTTALGGALQILGQCLEIEVRKTTAEVKGDWKPLVFLLTDGAPTDDWQTHAERLKQNKPSPANIIAVACGSNADVNVLKQITPTVLEMRDMGPEAFAQFFKWVSASVSQTSARVGAAPEVAAGGITLPPTPPQITIVP